MFYHDRVTLDFQALSALESSSYLKLTSLPSVKPTFIDPKARPFQVKRQWAYTLRLLSADQKCARRISKAVIFKESDTGNHKCVR